jgi:hypothetical protein
MSAKERAKLALATATAAAKDGSDTALCRGELHRVTEEKVCCSLLLLLLFVVFDQCCFFFSFRIRCWIGKLNF